MGAMGDSGRVGIILLAIAFLAPCVFIASPSVASTLIAEGPGDDFSATQYDPLAPFQSGVYFNDYSWALAVDQGVRDFAIGDLNGDELTDLATINQTNSICIYYRMASGSFDPAPLRLSGPSDMRSIVIGDLLGKDGRNDIAVDYQPSSGPGKLCIFNQSNGFEPLVLDLAGSQPYGLKIGVFSGSDNCLAVVCRGDPARNYDDSVEIWKYPFESYDNDRRFHSIPSSAGFSRSELLAVGDINGNGADDIAIGNAGGPNVFIMYQPTNWEDDWTNPIANPMIVPGIASDLLLGDVLGNNRCDLIFADAANLSGYSHVYVFRNGGTGLDQLPYISPINAFFTLGSVAIGNLSGSSGADLITLCKSSANASVYFRNSQSVWYAESANFTFPVDENPLKVIVDISMSGSEGVFILSQGPSNRQSTITFFKPEMSESGNANVNFFTGSQAIGAVTKGRMSNGEVVIASVLPSTNEVMITELNTSRTAILPSQSGPISVCMGRFNLDSDDDLAILNAVSGSVSIYNGSTLFTSVFPSTNITLPFTDGNAISSKSIMADGFDDLAIAYDSGVFILYCLRDWRFFAADSNESLGTGIPGIRNGLVWGDFASNDYSSDLAVMNADANRVEIYLRKSPGGPEDYYDINPSTNLTDSGKTFLGLASGDFGITTEPSNYGRTDLAVLIGGGEISIFLQPDFGFRIYPSFNPIIPRITLGSEGNIISAGDLNDDGMDDLAVGFSMWPQLSLLLRTGHLTFVNNFNFTTGAIPTSLLAGDMNGDRRLDLAVSSSGSHSISIWYENNLIPLANATASKYSEDEGMMIIFSGNNSNDSYSDRTSLDYNWTFLPSTFKSGVSVTHTYPQNGTYHVSLRVTDRDGLSNWSNLTITVLDTSPIADFSYAPISPTEGIEIFFTDASTETVDQITSYHWAFGDGETSELQNPSHTYQQNGSYPVTLTVWDADGSFDTQQRTVVVLDTAPSVDFVMSPNPAEEGTEVEFEDASTPSLDPIIDHFWTFGDGGSAHGIEVHHTYAQNDVYTVTLRVNDSDGSSVVRTKSITITDINPSAGFDFSPLAPHEGLEVQFTDESTSYDGITWLWDFDDGSTSTAQDPTHEFLSNGTYTVLLTIREADGNTSSITHDVVVSDLAPQADFTVSNIRIEGVPILFFDNSTSYDPLVSWNWSFGDGGYSQERNTSHVFAQDGVYLINLKVWDSDGSMSSKTVNLRVIDTGPNASFIYSPSLPNEGQDVSFHDTTIHIDALAGWYWSFGGLGTSTDQNPTMAFPSGQFNVTLTVWDVDMNESTYWALITVADLPLTASFDNSTAIEGSQASFDDTSISPYDEIVYRNWTFGDGASASGLHVTHAYNRSGDFLVSLTITDSDGTTATISRTITVIGVDPLASFTIEPGIHLEGATVQFDDTSFTFNSLDSWAWNFGDSSTSNLRDPTHIFQENGTYNVTLTVVESDGSSDTYYQLVSIADTSPTIISLRTSDGNFTYAEDQTVTFEVLATPGHDPLIVKYQWDLDFDGSFTQSPFNSLVNHISFQFSKNGTYRVSVRVWDHDSYCEATQLQVLLIEIVDPWPIAKFNFHNVSSGTVQFDASSSSDTRSDVDALLFSWNFDDGSGDGAWSTTRIFNHYFLLDGEYSVTLRVKDDSNHIAENTTTVRIDRIAPEVVLLNSSTSFPVGDAIQIAVTVNDPSGVSAVILQYRIDNATVRTISMTPSGTPSVYVGQIPPQNHNCTIAYWITATDGSSNTYTSGQLVITVIPRSVESTYFLLILSALLVVMAGLLLFMRKAIVPVDEVFIIYNDGRLMAHQTRRLKPGMDDEILSSMLVAIQGFVKDSFKDESSTHLQRLDFGEKKILVERGDSFYLAVVLHSQRAGNVPQRMQAVIDDIHREYGPALKEWDGDLEKVRGVKDQTGRLFKSPIPLALPMLRKERGAEPTECPTCGHEVAVGQGICPSCGTELGLSTVDELEEVAKGMEEAKGEGN